MIKVLLGSTSEAKIAIFNDTFKHLIVEEIEILGVEVESGVTDQPLDEVTTIQGSINRAKNALKQSSDADFAVGLEGGLHEIDSKGYFLICSAAIVDNKGHISVGVGGKLQLPKEVSDGVKQGGQFGVLIRQYQEKYKDDKEVVPLVEALISRKEAFEQAIKNAYLSYKNNKHFI